MKDTIVRLILSLLLAGSAAGDNVGLAYYGIQNPRWPCGESLKLLRHQKRPHIAMLWNTFGQDNTCLERFLADSRPKVLHLSLINECCQRRGDCQGYEFLHGLTFEAWRRGLAAMRPRIMHRLDRYLSAPAALIVDRTNLRCVVSPALETLLTGRAAAVLIAKTKEHFPQCKIAWNPLRPAWARGANMIETHGRNILPAPCVANLDGVDIDLPGRPSTYGDKIKHRSIPAWLSDTAHCSTSYLWIAEFNGRGEKHEPNRRKRTNWPDAALFAALRGLI